MVSARVPTATVVAIDEWARRNETTRSGAIALLVELGLSVKTNRRPRSGSALPSRISHQKQLIA
jgi:hypothetical protein